jgi:hypothetical protein
VSRFELTTSLTETVAVASESSATPQYNHCVHSAVGRSGFVDVDSGPLVRSWRKALALSAVPSAIAPAFVVYVGVQTAGSVEGTIEAALTLYVLTFLATLLFARAQFRMWTGPRQTTSEEARPFRRRAISPRDNILLGIGSSVLSVTFWSLVYPRPGEMVVTSAVLFLASRAWHSSRRASGTRRDPSAMQAMRQRDWGLSDLGRAGELTRQ